MIDPITPRLDALDSRLRRIEDKLDDHLTRVSSAEKDIEWLKGHVKMSTTVFLAAIGGLGALLLKYMFPSTPS